MSSLKLRLPWPVLLVCTLYAFASTPNLFAQDTTEDRAQSALVSGRYEDAMDAFEQILTAHPDDQAANDGEVDAASKAALALRKEGRMDDALAVLFRARKRVLPNATLLFDIGILENQMRLNQDAAEALQESLRLRPQDALTLYAIARVDMYLGEYGKAEAALQSYLDKRPDDASAHYGLGRALVIELKDEAALVEFRRAIELQPAQTESYFEEGEIELRQNNLEKAEADYQSCLARDPTHGGALTGLGIVAYHRKQFTVAEHYLGQAVRAAASYQTAHYYRGLVLAKLDRKQEADTELATAAKMAAEDDRKKREQLKLATQ